MTPPPPVLGERLARWKAEELFSIVKHGIKFTGMPGWPVQQRDDEVWAMVAFLRQLPTLDATGYQRLASGGIQHSANSGDRTAETIPAAVRDLCSRCHGITGTGPGTGAFPSLAGQRAAYLYGSLRAFRDRRRFSGIMVEVAARLSDDAMREIAAYYERQPARRPGAVPDDAVFTRGRTVATSGIPERDVPACAECHGPTTFPKNPAYPKLTGQYSGYLMSQLMLLQERRRGGTSNVNLMHAFVDRLPQADIRAVADYYAFLSPATDSPPRR